MEIRPAGSRVVPYRRNGGHEEDHSRFRQLSEKRLQIEYVQ